MSNAARGKSVAERSNQSFLPHQLSKCGGAILPRQNFVWSANNGHDFGSLYLKTRPCHSYPGKPKNRQPLYGKYRYLNP
jgi:hypothetical protein